MEASLIEVRAGTLGYVLVYRPSEWRAAIFKVYNRKVAEHAQLFPIFHSFETAFRSTAAVALERHYRHPRWGRGGFQAVRKGQPAKSVTRGGEVPMTKTAAFIIGENIETQDLTPLAKIKHLEFVQIMTLTPTR